jgi:hypothetical protein
MNVLETLTFNELPLFNTELIAVPLPVPDCVMSVKATYSNSTIELIVEPDYITNTVLVPPNL